MISKTYTCLLLFLSSLLGAQLKFSSLDSLLAYAEKNSVNIKTGNEQSLLAKWTKITALANSVNLRSPVSFASTDNSMLPVNFIPAEIFGGPPGTFRSITLGQRYVSNFNFNPQIDIINPYAWAKIKSASVNKELTAVNNLIVKRSLFESVAAAYYNIVSLQEQLAITKQSLAAADSIVYIVRNRFTQGIVREQDLNNAKVNQLGVSDHLNQLGISLAQQYNTLKVLCEIPAATQVQAENRQPAATNEQPKPTNDLNYRYSEVQSSFMKSELRANRLAMMPVVSLVYYQGWQQNSNTKLFDNSSPWIQSRYLGLRVSVPFPPDVNKLSQSYTSKINYRIARLNAEHTKLQNELSDESLALDQQKAKATYDISKQIFDLKRSNYEKSLNQYREGILSTDNLLAAFTDMLGSQLNYISAGANLSYAASRITIYNSVK